jgi:GABA(A) receptor-associated protein
MDFEFKNTSSLEKRLEESKRICEKYPDRVPVIVEVSNGMFRTKLPVLDKTKFLVPKTLSVGQFNYVIRKRIKLDPSVGIYIFFGNTIPAASALMGDVYNDHKDTDFYLYGKATAESVFGTDAR